MSDKAKRISLLPILLAAVSFTIFVPAYMHIEPDSIIGACQVQQGKEYLLSVHLGCLI